jgi:hypothetical protein
VGALYIAEQQVSAKRVYPVRRWHQTASNRWFIGEGQTERPHSPIELFEWLLKEWESRRESEN